MTVQDAQRILSVGPPEDTDEYRATLKEALRGARKAHHPDRNLQDPQGAETRFKEAQQAYQVLLEAAMEPTEDDDVANMVALLMAQNHALNTQNRAMALTLRRTEASLQLALDANVRLTQQLNKATRRSQALEETIRELRRNVLRSAAEAAPAAGRIRMAVRPEPAPVPLGEWDPPDDELDVLVHTSLHSPK